MLGDPDYAQLMADESDLIDLSTSLVLFTDPERVVMEGPSPEEIRSIHTAKHLKKKALGSTSQGACSAAMACFAASIAAGALKKAIISFRQQYL